MNRRRFAISLLAGTHCTRTWPGPVQAAGLDAVARIQALRITQGPLREAYRLTPEGGVNWYFSNLGLLAIVPHLDSASLDLHVRPHLDLYLARLHNDNTISDIHFKDKELQSFTQVPPDSDDSYAATFLSLSALYLHASGNWSWWEAHRNKLIEIAQHNILDQIKPNGLCRAMQPTRSSVYAAYGFTMNNCEDYRGLHDLSALLAQRGSTRQARVMREHTHQLGRAIHQVLWDPVKKGYRVSDQDTHADSCSFYPGSCCQVFAQVFRVHEATSRHAEAFRFLNTHAPQWPYKRHDAFPWCILGYAAAQRGDQARALAQLALTESLDRSHPEQMTLNELGFYLRTQDLLQGLSDPCAL